MPGGDGMYVNVLYNVQRGSRYNMQSIANQTSTVMESRHTSYMAALLKQQGRARTELLDASTLLVKKDWHP